MSRQTFAEMVGLLKKKGPVTLLCIRPHQTFTLWLPCSFWEEEREKKKTLRFLWAPDVDNVSSNYTRGVKGCLIRKTNTLKITVVFINLTQNLCTKRSSSRTVIWLQGLHNLHFICIQFLPFVQNLNYCTLRNVKLVWGMTRWSTRTALKGLTHSINSLITHTGPATSAKVTNTATLYKLWIPHFDAFNIWWRLSVLISEFLLHCDRWFCYIIPQNTLGFLFHWRHFDTSRLCNCNITINTT